jgi:hypothetical protein
MQRMTLEHLAGDFLSEIPFTQTQTNPTISAMLKLNMLMQLNFTFSELSEKYSILVVQSSQIEY